MTIWGLQPIDILAIAIYFAVVIYVGYRAMRRVKNQEDYFLGGRRFGKAIQIFAVFGQGTSAESAVTTTSVIVQKGGAGAWMMLAGGIFNLPIIWFMARWYRRMRLLTLADFFVDRYQSKGLAGLYAITQAMFFMIVAGTGFYAMSHTIAAIAQKPENVLTTEEQTEYKQALELEELSHRDYRALSSTEMTRLEELTALKPRKEFSYVNPNHLILFVAVIVVLYAITGGLEAAFVTDMIQGIFILILTVILIPFGWLKINAIHGTTGLLGPFQAMHRVLPEAQFELFGSPRLVDFTWYYIGAFVWAGSFSVVGMANQMTCAGSARDDTTAQIGFLSGIFLKRYCTLVWALIGMMMLTLYGTSVQNPDLVWGMATRELLGPLNIGLVGLMIACLMAALMSTADAHMITTSALLTTNIYRPLFPSKTEKHYLWTGRAFGLVYIIGGVTIAMNSSSIFKLFMEIVLFNAIVAAAIWFGVIWRKANRLAAWVSILVAFLLVTLLPILLPTMVPGLRTSEFLHKKTEAFTLSRTYTATPRDVEQRQKEIASWEAANQEEHSTGIHPRMLTGGKKFEKVTRIPAQSIFWKSGLKIEDRCGKRVEVGQGLLDVPLLLIQLCGWNLSNNSRSVNQTISVLMRWLIPFGLMFLVSLLTRPMPEEQLDQFYGKLRTPVNRNHIKDAQEMEATWQDPHRFDNQRLFRGGNWEFNKWSVLDWKAMGWCVAGTTGIIILLHFMMKIGS